MATYTITPDFKCTTELGKSGFKFTFDNRAPQKTINPKERLDALIQFNREILDQNVGTYDKKTSDILAANLKAQVSALIKNGYYAEGKLDFDFEELAEFTSGNIERLIKSLTIMNQVVKTKQDKRTYNKKAPEIVQ